MATSDDGRSYPEGFHEPAWPESVGRLSADDRRALLAWADQERAGGRESGARHASRVYLAVAQDLEPTSTEDAPRVAHLLSDFELHTPAVAQLATRTLDSVGPGTLRDDAAIVTARQLHREGRLADCEELLHDVISRRRHSGSWTEARAWERLAIVNAIEKRQFEALASLRRAFELFEALDAGPRALSLHVMRAHALLDLGDSDRAAAVVQAAEDLGRQEPPTPFRHRMFGLLRVAVLTEAHRDQDALELFETLPVEWFGEEGSGDRRMYLFQRATLLVDAGDFERGAAAVERALAAEPDGTQDRYHLRMLEALMRIRAETGQVDEALRRARELSELLRRGGRDTLGYVFRSTAARSVARTLSSCGGRLDEVRTAWEFSAQQMLARAAEVERSAAEVPEYVHLDRDDIAVLREWRERMAGDWSDILAEVRRHLAANTAVGDVAHTATVGRIAACAWCSRVRTIDGHWLPIAHYLPLREDPFDVSHGICDECLESTMKEAEAVR